MKKEQVLAKFFRVYECIFTQSKNSPIKLNHTSKAILCNLLRNKEDTINQRNLASMLKVSPQAVCESIKKLENLELVIKKSGTQKNENLISLTKLGEEKATLLNEKIVNHSNEVFKDFTDDELQEFYRLLDKIN